MGGEGAFLLPPFFRGSTLPYCAAWYGLANISVYSSSFSARNSAGFSWVFASLAQSTATAPLAPITAISAEGQAKLRSERSCLQPITMWEPP